MVITENCRKTDHVILFLDMFICLKHFLCTILDNKFDKWNFSRVANIKTILWECNWADLKKMLVSVLLPAQPPKIKLPFRGDFFFLQNPGRHYLPFIKNCIFRESVIQTMLHWLSFEIFFLYYGQHFGLCTIYSKRSIKIWSGLKKKKKKELPTYSFWNWCVGAQQTKNFLGMALIVLIERERKLMQKS